MPVFLSSERVAPRRGDDERSRTISASIDIARKARFNAGLASNYIVAIPLDEADLSRRGTRVSAFRGVDYSIADIIHLFHS